MSDPVQSYRDAIARRIHTVCIDRNLDPRPTSNTEAHCQIERYLPQLVALVQASGPESVEGFAAGVGRTICHACGNQDDAGVCRRRNEVECCLYRYLLLIYDAIDEVLQRSGR